MVFSLSNRFCWGGLNCALAFRRGEIPVFGPKMREDDANVMTRQTWSIMVSLFLGPESGAGSVAQTSSLKKCVAAIAYRGLAPLCGLFFLLRHFLGPESEAGSVAQGHVG